MYLWGFYRVNFPGLGYGDWWVLSRDVCGGGHVGSVMRMV